MTGAIRFTGGVRFKRVAMELRLRRRRLDSYRTSPPWPGKEPAWRPELGRYDQYRLLAAEILEIEVREPPSDRLLSPAARAALEDRLALAGLDVFAPAVRSTGDLMKDGAWRPELPAGSELAQTTNELRTGQPLVRGLRKGVLLSSVRRRVTPSRGRREDP